MKIRTCVSASGEFIYGIHEPRFRAENFRENDEISCLGFFEDGTPCENHVNFPPGAVKEEQADPIYEVPNPFPFRGTTYIIKSAAERNAENLSAIALPERPALSMSDFIKKWSADDLSEDQLENFFHNLPEPLLLTLASNSTDPEDLTRIADFCCEFVRDPETGRPLGLVYEKDANGRAGAKIKNHTLCEVLANNIFLPDDYKEVMVLRPGVQGGSEITGEWVKEGSHIFEYLRRNSYISWGHYAANMANDAIRYRAGDLSLEDMKGMRHLYYQRTYVRMAEELGLPLTVRRKNMSAEELENLRKSVSNAVSSAETGKLNFNSTLWGWNLGFDYSPSHYRLHASHQQIHQQYALIPSEFSHKSDKGDELAAFAFGDLIADFIQRYREDTGKNFFDNYISAVKNNSRMDGRENSEASLIVYEDENVLLFVPKAQTSQWELQLMTIPQIGNIIEADSSVRDSLDRAMLKAVQILEKMGARMITNIEASKRFDSSDTDHRLLYCFLPKMPYSPGSFTEAQLRWINGHYPEDFAAACRMAMKKIK